MPYYPPASSGPAAVGAWRDMPLVGPVTGDARVRSVPGGAQIHLDVASGAQTSPIPICVLPADLVSPDQWSFIVAINAGVSGSTCQVHCAAGSASVVVLSGVSPVRVVLDAIVPLADTD